MAFWSGETLATSGTLVTPFAVEQIDCNAYTLRMGNCYYRTADQETGHEQKKTFLAPGEAFLIPPGQFAYLLSKETIHVPHDAMAFISMKTGIKWQGLINVSGFHVDPGYNGKLIYAVYNASPSAVQICENDPVFKIWFCSMDRKSATPYIFAKPGVNDIGNDLIKGMSKEILSLQSLANKLRDQEKEFAAKLAALTPTIDNLTFVWRAITLTVIGGLLVAFLVFSLPSVFKLGEAVADWWSTTSQKKPVSPKAKD